MKISFEVDITPQEVLELFDGNVEVLQKSIVELLMKQFSHSNSPDHSMMTFWQAMSERSSEMFKQYQAAMSSTVKEPGKNAGKASGAATKPPKDA